MLTRWKVPIVSGLFVFGAFSFLLGMFPDLAGIFWLLWITGCGVCILGLILAVVVPRRAPREVQTRPEPLEPLP